MKIKVKIIILTSMFISIPFVFAATMNSSSNVMIDNTMTNWSRNLQDAISEINYFCSVKCPNGYSCKTNTPKCVRATTLHTETCSNDTTSYYCRGDGYALNGTITYGNETTTSGILTVGDAFDCDVNGDGTYDAETERFYYISDYYDTSRKIFNDNVAVLVYYSNTDDGVASTTNVTYDCSNENWHGPVSAIGELPTTVDWNNIKLYKNTRQILAKNGATTTSDGILPMSFDYTGYAARLLTYQELLHGCYDYNIGIGGAKGLSTNCKFLFERTKYANSSLTTSGSWLETPDNSSTNYAYYWNTYSRSINASSSVNDINNYGVRPTIEILKSELSY